MMRLAHPRVIALLSLFALLAALLAATPVAARIGGGSAGKVAGVDARTLFDRVHIIGASASAGFGVRAPLPSGHPGRTQPMPLARIAQAACTQNGTCTGDATSLFFASPVTTGRAQVDAVVEAKQRPTVVIGVDYLFWFTYGALNADRTRIKYEAERLALLEVGLANLDRILKLGVPIVVGDLPDMSDAVGKMLSPSQMPALATLEAANKRLKAWAVERPLVAIVPLAALVKQLDSDQPFQAGNRQWSSKTDGALIQPDRLHPTFVGSVALLARTEQAATEHFRRGEAPGLAPAALEHDPAKVSASVRASIEAELAKRAGKAREAGKQGAPDAPSDKPADKPAGTPPETPADRPASAR